MTPPQDPRRKEDRRLITRAGRYLDDLTCPSGPSAISHRLKGTDISTWNSNFWNLANWYRA